MNTRTQTLIALVGALVCLALIGFSAWALFAPNTAGQGLFQTTVEAGDSGSTDGAADHVGASAGTAASAGSGSGSASNADGADGSGVAGGQGASAGSNPDASVSSNGANGTGAGEAASSGVGAGSSGGSGASSGGSVGAGMSSGSGASAGSDSSAGSGSNNTATANQILVTVTVTGLDGSTIVGSTQVTLESGATVYDALLATGVSVNARSTGLGVYVAGIGGLAEKDHGPESGWKYAVNGVDASVSCSGYPLSDGDAVTWRYVTSVNG